MKNKFLSLAYGYRNNFSISDKLDGNVLSISNFMKLAFASTHCTLSL